MQRSNQASVMSRSVGASASWGLLCGNGPIGETERVALAGEVAGQIEGPLRLCVHRSCTQSSSGAETDAPRSQVGT